jgi:hypothetical protein
MQTDETRLGARLKDGMRYRRSGSYWLFLVGLGVLGAILMLVIPARRDRPLIPEPTVPRPRYQVFATEEKPGNRLERLNVALLVPPDMPNDTLKAALNWALFSTLDEQNRVRRRTVRVVWLYALTDTSLALARWRAMAIWADPKLPPALVPAHSGGDAVREGDTEYDFTNPVVSAETATAPGPNPVRNERTPK